MTGRGRQSPRFSEVVVDSDLIDTWDLRKKEAAAATAEEREFRRSITDSLFSGADEGSHNLDMSDGRVLNMIQGVERKVDIATLDSIRAAMIEKFGIDPDTLIRWKPDIKITEYKALRKANPDAATFFEQCLVISDSMPSLKIVEPSAYRLKQAKANAEGSGDGIPPGIADE